MSQTRKWLVKGLEGGLRLLGEAPTEGTHAGQPGIGIETLRLGEVLVDFRAHELKRADEIIPLTPSEYEILITLASNHGDLVDYVSLVKSALGYDAEPQEAKELIKRHIFTFRQKIGPNFESPRYILNVREYGYRLASADRKQTSQ